MGGDTSVFQARPEYRDHPPAPESRVSEVATFYHSLTDRRIFPKVQRLLAIITRIHADDTERLMREVYEAIGVDNLLAILRDTPRGRSPVLGNGRRGRTAAQRPTPNVDDLRSARPSQPASAARSQPILFPRSRRAPASVGSEWFDGNEDWAIPTAKPNCDGFIQGLIYAPETRPPFDPTNKQRWDRPYWEREAAKRAETGDLTVAAMLAFWDLLDPEDRVLPQPTAIESDAG